MSNMEYIEDYFNGDQNDEQKQEFEQRIVNDASFAEDVAFYISATAVIKEELKRQKKERFREIYNQPKIIPVAKRPVKRMWRYVAAASVAALLGFLSWFVLNTHSSGEQLADQFIEKNWAILDVKMNNGFEDIQRGAALFNDHKLQEALAIFEGVLKEDSKNFNALKYAGIASLRLKQYGNALHYFSLLTADSAMHANPGKLYEAVTLLKRNSAGDEANAKIILREIVEKDMEGKKEAEQWLKQLP